MILQALQVPASFIACNSLLRYVCKNLLTLLVIKDILTKLSPIFLFDLNKIQQKIKQKLKNFFKINYTFVIFIKIKIMNITGREETPIEILKHPANNSTAKYLYSFSKSRRFSQNRGYTNTISYNLPSSISQRKAGFGYGSRSKFFDGQNTTNPSPGKYQAKSQFQIKGQKKGHSFTCNRDQLMFANYLKQSQNTPAAYTLTESQVKKSRAYTMRPKTAYPKNYFIPNQEDNLRMKQFPGPGKYETIDMLGSGKDFCNSKFKTQKQKSFNGGDRFLNGKKTPGPGDYKIQHSIQPDGIYLLSNMIGSGRRQILNQKRQLKLTKGNKQTPGPGAYKKPSDFGHYERPAPLVRPKTARN